MCYRERTSSHFHAEDGEFEIAVEIEASVVTGRFRCRVESGHGVVHFAAGLGHLRVDTHKPAELT